MPTTVPIGSFFVRKKNVRVELMYVSRRDIVLDWLAGKRDTS